MSEQRSWPRMNLDLEVYLHFDSFLEASQAQTTNISREGLFIHMDPPRQLGTKVRVRVNVDNPRREFVLEGVVVRTVPDADAPRDALPHEVPGVGIFLTSTSQGWTTFCDELSKGD